MPSFDGILTVAGIALACLGALHMAIAIGRRQARRRTDRLLKSTLDSVDSDPG